MGHARGCIGRRRHVGLCPGGRRGRRTAEGRRRRERHSLACVVERGTTAGLAAHAGLSSDSGAIVAISVSDSVEGLSARIEAIWRDALGGNSGLDVGNVEIRDDYIGRGYGLATAAEIDAQFEATALTGLLFDPAYTGKAIYALRREIEQGRFASDDDVVFWHTGGGFAGLAFDYEAVADPGS